MTNTGSNENAWNRPVQVSSARPRIAGFLQPTLKRCEDILGKWSLSREQKQQVIAALDDQRYCDGLDGLRHQLAMVLQPLDAKSRKSVVEMLRYSCGLFVPWDVKQE